VSTVPTSLVSYRHLLEDAIRRRARRRRTVVRFALAGTAASIAVLAVVGAVSDRAPWAVSPASAESVVRRAAAAVGAKPGTILHVDMTGTQRNPDGSTVTWRDESWQLESAPYGRRQIETGPDGSTVESGSGPNGDEVYDAATNTIYVDPHQDTESAARMNAPHLARGPRPGTYTLRAGKARPLVITAGQARALKRGTLSIAWKISKRDHLGALGLIPTPKPDHGPDSTDEADPSSPAFRAQILTLLESGGARVVGHRTIDGRDTIELSSGDGHTRYYVDPDTYAPVELDTTGTGGGVSLRFAAYEALPATGHRSLLDLEAQHPNAAVDRSAADYGAAQARLFPHG